MEDFHLNSDFGFSFPIHYDFYMILENKRKKRKKNILKWLWYSNFFPLLSWPGEQLAFVLRWLSLIVISAQTDIKLFGKLLVK